MKRLFLDTETTGLDPAKHAIWDLVAIPEIDGVAGETFQAHLAPDKDQEISSDALELAKLTQEQLYAFRPQKEGYERFVRILQTHVDQYDKKDKFVLMGYNVGFDEAFLRQLFMRQGNKFFGSYFWWPALDIAQLAMEAIGEDRAKLMNFKLQTVCEHFLSAVMLEGFNWHSALADTQATMMLYGEIQKRQNRQVADPAAP